MTNGAQNRVGSEKSDCERNHRKSAQICITKIIFRFASRKAWLVSIFANLELELQRNHGCNSRHYKQTQLGFDGGGGGLNIVHVNLACRTRRN